MSTAPEPKRRSREGSSDASILSHYSYITFLKLVSKMHLSHRAGGFFQLLQFCEHKSALYPMASRFCFFFINTMDKLHLDVSVLADVLVVIVVIVVIVIIVPGLRNFVSPMYNISSYVPLRGQHCCFICPLADTKENETPVVVVQTSSNTHYLPYQTTWCLSRYNLRNATA